MIAKASLRFTRGSGRKIRQVISLIKGKDAVQAIAILTAVNKGSKTMILKLLKSALANARKSGLQESQLYISKLVANNGPMYKRYRAAPFGRATTILKPTCHIDLELEMKMGAILPSKPSVAKKPKTTQKKGIKNGTKG